MTIETRDPIASDNIQPPPAGCHIAVVSETFPPEVNGVANTLRHLCAGLAARGHQVSVIRPRQRGETRNAASSPELSDDTVVVTGIPLPGYPDLRFGLTSSARVGRLWQAQRPDFVYVATQGPLGVAAVTAARRLKIPVVSGFHTNFHAYSHYYGAGFLETLLCRYGRWFHNRTALTLAPTEKMQQEVSALGIRPVAIWGRGIDCQHFAPHKRDSQLRQKWGLQPQDRAVIYVGRLAAEKNLQLAIACYERIRALHPRTRFILVGHGPLQRSIQARHPDYIFCGSQVGETLARHYASGDIFLFPSKTDTFGNVVTEAMASGLAVVAFDNGAAREHIRHGDNGMVADMRDDDQFIDHALQLVDQPTQMNRIRAQARMDALELGWSTRIVQFEQLLNTLQHKVPCHAHSKQSFTTL